MTECSTELYENFAARIEEVGLSPCVIGGCCSDTYVQATLKLLRELPGWKSNIEQKALAGAGFAHLYNADGYR